MLSLNGHNLAVVGEDERVRVIEYESMFLSCKSGYDNTTISWHRNGYVVLNVSIDVDAVRPEDTGFYTCRVTGANFIENKRIFVEVLYPASYPSIEGVPFGLVGEPVTLKCIAEAFPKPTYEWRFEDENGKVVSKNQTFQETIPYYGYKLVCKVNTLMIPTFGKPKRGVISVRTSIKSYIPAYIQDVLGGFEWRRSEGDTVNIYCATAGNPVPRVWWTKVGDASFFYKSNSLKAYNITKDFAGYYVCHAENTVMSVNETTITTNDTEQIRITVIEREGMERKICKADECALLCNKTRDLETQQNQSEPQKTDKTGHALIIAGGICGPAMVLSVALNLWLLKKQRIVCRERQSVYTQSSHQTPGEEQRQTNYNPSLPETTPSYIQDVRITDNTYTDISTYDRIENVDGTETSGMESNGTVVSTAT